LGAAEIRKPRDRDTCFSDRVPKRHEMNAGITSRVMGKRRQGLTIGLRNVLSRDSATRSRQRGPGCRGRTSWPEFEVPVATRFEHDTRVCSRNVGRFWKSEASGRPNGVFRYLYRVVRRMRFRLRMHAGDMVEFAA